MWKKWIAFAGFVAALGAGWLVYQDSLARTAMATNRRPPSPPVTVEIAPARIAAVEEAVELVGTIEPLARVEIRSKVDGYIQELPFTIGDSVRRDDLLVRIDDSRPQEELSRAQAQAGVAKAQLRAATARANLAEREYQRTMDLRPSGVSTISQEETVRAESEVALAEVELAEAGLAEAQSAVTAARIGLAETRIASPLSGFVAERLVEVGTLAQPNTPLLSLVQLDKVRTRVNVVERDYHKVEVGQSAVILADAYDDRTFQGTVVEKSPVLDPETRTAVVNIEIDNTDTLLKPGMYARVRLVVSRKEEAIVVPIAAVLRGADDTAVMLVRGDPPVAERRTVTTGSVDGPSVEIRSGLSLDEQVITLGNRLVRAGEPVTTRPAPSTTAPSGMDDPDDGAITTTGG